MSRGMTPAGVRKWKEFERAVARELRKLAPGAKRNLQYQRDHGSPDVSAGVLWVECKSGKKNLAVETVYRQAAQKARGNKNAVPAVVSRAGPRGPMVVTLALKDFIVIAHVAGATQATKRKIWRGRP